MPELGPVNPEFVELLPGTAEPVVDAEPLGGFVWLVPAVGLLFADRLELPLAPAPELHGRPFRPVPDMDELFSPELLPLGEEPGVAEGLDPLLMPPAAEPALPPLAPPPVWANTRLAVPAIRVAANIVTIVSVLRITSPPVCSASGGNDVRRRSFPLRRTKMPMASRIRGWHAPAPMAARQLSAVAAVRRLSQDPEFFRLRTKSCRQKAFGCKAAL